MDNQPPLLNSLSGGRSQDAARWDAQTEYDVGVLIASYLVQHPPPPGVHFEEPFARWSAALQRQGQAQLAELGERRLRAV